MLENSRDASSAIQATRTQAAEMGGGPEWSRKGFANACVRVERENVFQRNSSATTDESPVEFPPARINSDLGAADRAIAQVAHKNHFVRLPCFVAAQQKEFVVMGIENPLEPPRRADHSIFSEALERHCAACEYGRSEKNCRKRGGKRKPSQNSRQRHEAKQHGKQQRAKDQQNEESRSPAGQ